MPRGTFNKEHEELAFAVERRTDRSVALLSDHLLRRCACSIRIISRTTWPSGRPFQECVGCLLWRGSNEPTQVIRNGDADFRRQMRIRRCGTERSGAFLTLFGRSEGHEQIMRASAAGSQ